MTILTHRRGTRRVYSFIPETEEGEATDLAEASGELRVSAEGICIPLPGVIEEGALQVDLQPLDLPAGQYTASLYFDWGQGPEFEGDLIIDISEGC
ncbi:hypothetical protein RGQ15_13575 [Paracoccus sp. MBLB3053]|uniref:PilZ domain-containing protein n=1 Tax=Paracoccus aurantius TaxID=3073814 RepID=A0ABU2HVG5_9RHOB|nr:hypothetical protein [Paracoccus sp. MBLB3053]MDS9468594.1 hypothetical protein [Paracoccus sp. MBLB3053]